MGEMGGGGGEGCVVHYKRLKYRLQNETGNVD